VGCSTNRAWFHNESVCGDDCGRLSEQSGRFTGPDHPPNHGVDDGLRAVRRTSRRQPDRNSINGIRRSTFRTMPKTAYLVGGRQRSGTPSLFPSVRGQGGVTLTGQQRLPASCVADPPSLTGSAAWATGFPNLRTREVESWVLLMVNSRLFHANPVKKKKQVHDQEKRAGHLLFSAVLSSTVLVPILGGGVCGGYDRAF